MSRSPSVSRGCAVPFCGTQVPPLPQARVELATLMGLAADRVAVPVAKFSVSFRRNSWPGLLFCQVTKRPGRAVRWRRWTIEIGGQVAAFSVRSRLANLGCRCVPRQHLRPIETAQI